MQSYSSTPMEMCASFWRNRGLIKNLVQREVIGRYKNSVLGLAWSLVTPVMMLCVYTFVFSVVFQARWTTDNTSKVEFAMVLFAGLIVFNLFAECISRAPNLVVSNSNYVKKVIFPLEVLPWVPMGGALFHFSVSSAVWIIAYSFLVGSPHWTIALIPIVVAPFVLFVMGLSWILASLGVFLRDVGHVTSVLIQVLMFATPIFYPVSALPDKLQRLVFLNPLAPIVEMFRDLMYWGKLPSLFVWTVGCALSMIIAVLGFAWFQKTRKGFADVI